MEELGEVRYLVIDDLFVVDVVVWLEVDAGISHEEKTLNLDQWQDLLHVELALELRHLANVLQSALVEPYLLVRHYSADHVPLRCVVEALGHSLQDLQDLLALVVERVSVSHIGLKEEPHRLKEVVDVTETYVDVKAVFLGAIFRRPLMLLVRLRRGRATGNLNQLSDFH